MVVGDAGEVGCPIDRRVDADPVAPASQSQNPGGRCAGDYAGGPRSNSSDGVKPLQENADPLTDLKSHSNTPLDESNDPSIAGEESSLEVEPIK